MAGWQCAAGRAILRLEASAFGPLAGTTKNTILRFESGEFMPRPATVLQIERTLRERGVYPIYDKRGEPKGINVNWIAYATAYPARREATHKRPEEIAARQRAAPQQQVMIARADQHDAIAALEAQQARLREQLEEFRRLESFDDDEDDDDDWRV